MLRRMVSDPAASALDAAGGGGDAGRRGGGGGGGGGALFAVPRLFVGMAAKRGAADGGEPAARSPTSPLDPKALLLRSPRSPRTWWDAEPVGLGLALAAAADDDAAAAAKNCLLSPLVGPLKSFASLPKDCGGGHSLRPELAKAMSCAAAATAAAGMSVPCGVFFHGDLKSGPEATRSGGAHPNAMRRSFDLGCGKIPGPGSLPASIAAGGGGVRRFIGSVSASDIEQSEDYTCIIARGPNPKTTHIFGDCILEPQTIDASAAMDVTEAATKSYWVVKCDDAAAVAGGGGGDDFLSSCFTCKKKLEGNDIYIYRGEKAFCSTNCRDQQILIEEEAENTTTTVSSPRSSCSSLHEDIFMAGMIVAT